MNQRAFDDEAKRWHDKYQELLQHIAPDVPESDRHSIAKRHIQAGEQARLKTDKSS